MNLQEATSRPTLAEGKAAYESYSAQMTELQKACTLRGMLRFRPPEGGGVPLEEVRAAATVSLPPNGLGAGLG
jgi:hypothetical protein